MLKKTASYLPVCILSLSLPLMSVACVMEGGEGAEGEWEEIGTAESALCGDTALSPDATGALDTNNDNGSQASGTSGSSYGSSFCAGRWVYDVTNTANQPNLSVYALWNNALTQTTCSQGHVNAEVYGWNGSSWVYIDTVSGSGTWVTVLEDSYCDVSAGMSVSNTYSKIRLAGKAWQHTQFIDITRPVTEGGMERP